MKKRRNVVGSNIRNFRQKTGITQEELALKSGLSQGYINQLEKGKRNYTQKSLELIADALPVEVKELFTEEQAEAACAVAETPAVYTKRKRTDRKEFLSLLKDLPENIAAHYLTLLKLERELLKKEGRAE